MRIFRTPHLALVAALALISVVAVVAACGDDDGDMETLKIGVLLPETGALAAYGGPMIESVRLAEADIKEAGGAIEVIYADSGTDPDVAGESTNRLIGEGAHVVVGAAASGISQAVIQRLYDEKIPQCSPSNTSPSFSTQANAGYYFRTAPSDAAASVVMANTVVDRGGTRVSIVARADDYGQALANLMEERLGESGAETDKITYDPMATTFDAEISSVTNFGPDAIVLIVFDEGVNLIRGLLEAGFDPGIMYGSDGVYRPDLNEAIVPDNPGVLDGMTLFVATAPSGPVLEAFQARLAEATNEEGNDAFGAQSYDCTVILALAARAAGAVDGDAIIRAVSEVTSGGRECTTYADCAQGIDDGDDVAYVGKVGALRLNAGGDPTVAIYKTGQFQDGALVELSVDTVDLK